MGWVVKVDEFHEGLRGGSYYFVVEGRRLVHISRYALSERRGYGTSYYIDLSKVRGKTIIEVFSSRSGPSSKAWAFPAEDLPLEWSARRRQDLPISFINDYELVHLEASEKHFLAEWDRYYRPMLKVMREEERRGSKFSVTDLLRLHIENDLKYPLSFLIPYSEKARLMSLSGLTKQIHQIWIIVRLLREFTSKPLTLFFGQSSSTPLAIIGDYALWYEFDLNPLSMFRGILWYEDLTGMPNIREIPPSMKVIYEEAKRVRRKYGAKRLALRPDIAFTYAKDAEEFMERPSIKLIVECKNADHTFWEREVEEQVKPYAEIFQPEHIVVASLKPVPRHLKEGLSSYGVDVIDNVYLGGPGERELVTYVKRALGYA
jgi:hypothetical protein